MKITVLIAEDDPDMRHVLKKVVKEVDGVEVVGEAGNGTEALEMIENIEPQVVFIDIDLPEKNGVELAREVFDINPWTFIVFATAFSQYRGEAFDVYAFDYLVKPFKLNRVRQTMERIKKVITGRIGAKPLPLKSSSNELNDKIIIKGQDKIVCLNAVDIVFITKEGRKAAVYFAGGKINSNESLSVLEERLEEYQFYRSHSGFIVNLNMIREIIPISRNTFELVMAHTRERPLMTYEKFKEFEKLFNW